MRCVGRADEWHLVFAQAFKYLTFDLFPGFREAVLVFRSSFRHAWLKAVGAIRDTVRGDGLQQLLVEFLSTVKTPVALVSNYQLESLEDLDRRLETDGSWLDVNLTGRLSHDRPDQIVG